MICIDPGHGKEINPGIINDYYEGTVMYELALKIKNEIEKDKNYKAVLTKYSKSCDPDIKERIDSIDISNPECFISLHSLNTNNTNAFYDSVAVYTNNRSSETLRQKLLDSITLNIPIRLSCMCKESTPSLEYIKGDIDIFELLQESTNYKIDFYVISFGYNNDEEYCNWILKSTNQELLAKSIASTIIKYYDEVKK